MVRGLGREAVSYKGGWSLIRGSIGFFKKYTGLLFLQGGSKDVMNFPWIFLCDVEFSLCWALPIYPGTYSLGLFAGLFGDAMGYCISCEMQEDDGSTGSSKLPLFQLPQHLHVTNC